MPRGRCSRPIWPGSRPSATTWPRGSRARKPRNKALARLESSEADRLAVEQAAAAEADRLLTERDVVIGRLEAQKAETQKALADREGLAADLRREKAEAEVARGHRRAIEAERDDLIRRLSEMGDGDFSTHYPDEPAGSAGPAVEALKAETARADALAADLAAARAQIEEMTQALAVTQFSLDILRPSIGVAPPSGTGPTPITSASRDRIDALTRELDGAKKEIVQLRTVLDYLGVEDPTAS